MLTHTRAQACTHMLTRTHACACTCTSRWYSADWHTELQGAPARGRPPPGAGTVGAGGASHCSWKPPGLRKALAPCAPLHFPLRFPLVVARIYKTQHKFCHSGSPLTAKRPTQVSNGTCSQRGLPPCCPGSLTCDNTCAWGEHGLCLGLFPEAGVQCFRALSGGKGPGSQVGASRWQRL